MSPIGREYGESTPALTNQMVEHVPRSSRWSGIAGGVLVASSLWLVLHLFGMGAGLTAIDPEDASSLKGAGLGVGVWSVIAPLIALFVGGLVASRMSPSPSRVNRVINGALVWSISTLFAVTLVVTVVGRLVSGATKVGGDAIGAVAGAATSGAGALDDVSLSSLGLDAADVLEPINERLRDEGKPAVTPRQLETAARQAFVSAVRSGSFDRQLVETSLAKNTALTQRDVTELAGQIEERYAEMAQQTSELATRAKEAALEAAETTGKAIMGLALALLLGLAAAVGGAVLTGQQDRRRATPVVINSSTNA